MTFDSVVTLRGQIEVAAENSYQVCYSLEKKGFTRDTIVVQDKPTFLVLCLFSRSGNDPLLYLAWLCVTTPMMSMT